MRALLFGSIMLVSKGKIMSRRPRRNHWPEFKAEVALEAVLGEQPLAELAQKYDDHAT